MATVPTQEAPNARPARDDHCPPTKPKKRPRSLADVPQAVLHKEIFRFDALQRENAHLRSEVARLRKILTQPYRSSALELKSNTSRRWRAGTSSHAGTMKPDQSLELIKRQASIGRPRGRPFTTDDLVPEALRRVRGATDVGGSMAAVDDGRQVLHRAAARRPWVLRGSRS